MEANCSNNSLDPDPFDTFFFFNVLWVLKKMVEFFLKNIHLHIYMKRNLIIMTWLVEYIFLLAMIQNDSRGGI